LLVGVIAFVVTRPDDQDPSTEAGSPTSSSSTAEPTEDEESTTGADETTSDGAVTGDAPSDDPLAAANITAFLQDYHRQVLTDPRAAYARTGPTLRSVISEDNYVGYWSDFSDVRLSDIQAVDGQNTATATQELVYAGGGSESSRRIFTFLVQDGELVLDSDYAAE
jgi:hypothetical protein